jgi:hypothetical protein
VTPYVLDTTGGTVTGTIVLGSVITSTSTGATGTVVGEYVAVLNTPATGKYIMGPAPGATAVGTNTTATIVLASNVETSFICQSSGLANELVKITNHDHG